MLIGLQNTTGFFILLTGSAVLLLYFFAENPRHDGWDLVTGLVLIATGVTMVAQPESGNDILIYLFCFTILITGLNVLVIFTRIRYEINWWWLAVILLLFALTIDYLLITGNSAWGIRLRVWMGLYFFVCGIMLQLSALICYHLDKQYKRKIKDLQTPL